MRHDLEQGYTVGEAQLGRDRGPSPGTVIHNGKAVSTISGPRSLPAMDRATHLAQPAHQTRSTKSVDNELRSGIGCRIAGERGRHALPGFHDANHSDAPSATTWQCQRMLTL